jgi:Zn-dependent protease
MFVPGLGAFVRMSQYPTDAHEEARTGLAGPLWGLTAAIVAAVVGRSMHSTLATSVASAGATLNLFNLIPVWVLDGSRGLRALDRRQRLAVGGTAALSALVLHQWMPLIVGAIALVRAFDGDAHPTGDRRVFALFATLIVALSLVAALPVAMPG